jgi:hypothetical protein
MTVPMKARRSFPYAGKRLKAGDEFQARGESDARVLAAIGHAERVIAAPAAPPIAATGYSTRMMTAAPAATPPVPMRLAAQYVIKVDGGTVSLDDMEADELHALAKRLDVKVHHLAGARKVRQALLDAQAGK